MNKIKMPIAHIEIDLDAIEEAKRMMSGAFTGLPLQGVQKQVQKDSETSLAPAQKKKRRRVISRKLYEKEEIARLIDIINSGGSCVDAQRVQELRGRHPDSSISWMYYALKNGTSAEFIAPYVVSFLNELEQERGLIAPFRSSSSQNRQMTPA